MTAPTEANMTTLQEALPCPFCGKQHTLQLISGQELMGEDQEFWQHSESFGVVCDASQPEGKGGCGAMGGFKPTEEEAIEAWNTRTALAQQGEPVAWAIYDKRGGSKSLHWAEQHTDGNAEMYNAVPLYKAAPEPQAQEPTAWRTEALKWIRRKAEDQRATNEQNPRHAEAYPSWGERVRQWHWLADELELEQNSTSFGLEPYQEPAPQPAHQGERAELIRQLYAIANTEANEVADALNEAADMLQSAAQPKQEPLRELTDEEILALEKQTPAMNDAGEEWIYFARAVLKKAKE